MFHTTLISTADLSKHLSDPNWAVVDCRFSLNDTERGRRDYKQAHIPGAVYAHLDDDLSGLIIPGQTGRHPLPAVETFAQTLSHWGIGPGVAASSISAATEGSAERPHAVAGNARPERSRRDVPPGVQVVAYDDFGGAVAARLWWLLRWLGYEAVAVLDGGWPQWQREGRPSRAGIESRPARTFKPQPPREDLVVSTADVLAHMNDPNFRLLDSRSAERYRGENEPIDPVAGRVPGAVSVPFADNLSPDGRFLPPEELRARFQAVLGTSPPEQCAFYCGSGVTAAHNVLALVHAGLGEARLYAGSWSEWITDPSRPVVVGDDVKRDA